ncbi:eukaryotic translation initiation factor 4E transporter-like isoform X2 [Hyposmocoma kahamanoa]|uniref:eukaryotic translation initiation factor 4E transporter-like isoform X2 n=1 Tax=Hyposmocoma kahamanoa TaxID=1477025 RepID=UPI000E6DA02A|nr:eukaryotic translation initiation factor 4E transporter-like isoform X2 [Hyposmocoma kahamanoa]
MVSKEKDVPAQVGEVMKKSRRRRRRAGSRAAKRRARKANMTLTISSASDNIISPVKCAVHAFLLRYQSALRKVPAHIPPRVHAGPPSKRVKRVSWRHDEEESVGVGGGGGAGGGDPAVLCVGPARRPISYSRDELLRLRNSPLVKRGLENAFAGCDALALVLKRRSDSPNEEDRGARGDAPNENHKGVYGRERDRERRSADPRERVRKESEPSGGGIVLSPQRRSFTSGCGAPAAAAPPPHVARTRPESPLGATTVQPPAQAIPAKPDQGRRIGSGRIMVRDANAGWEEGEWGGGAEPYRPPRDRDSHAHRANNDRFERRSFGRDSYSSDIKRERDERFNNDKGGRDREDNRRSGGRYSQRRFEKEDEPEWFSGGPTSQLETIELRGFDEPTKKNGTSNTKDEKWNNGGSRSPERWRSEAVSSPVPQNNNDAANNSNDKDSGVESKTDEPQPNPEQPDFNLDEFLKFDSIPDVLTNGGSESEGGSRFSRWFRRESPTNDTRHYDRLLHNIVDDLDSSTRLEQPPAPAPEPANVFAPISPAAPPSLLELLRRANANAESRAELNSVGGANANAGGAGKIHSLEELEARLRPHHSQPMPQPDHDLSAFKRLLAQVSGGHAVPAAEQQRAPHQPQPMSLLQMLNKSMEQQQKVHAPAQPHIPQELLYKLLQVQQVTQRAAMQAGELPHAPAPAPTPAPIAQADRDLLQRPEAQAIIHGLKAGEITVQHLMQQLGNPGLQSRHREVLLTILRLHQQQRQQQMGGSPLPTGVGVANPAAHLVVPPHHQPLRLSPLPHPAFCVSPIMPTSPNTLAVHHPGVQARIPSPRELAAHTQSIMQGALIKKKLEEQRENFRRRQEMQLPKQPTPISFTPTSVLRKMTAEKESDAQSPKQQWAQPPKVPQGRPIVKGNQSGAAPVMGYVPSPADYQQHYLNQQQQMVAGIRPFPHSQQRQQVPASFNNMNNMARSVAGGTTLHQLLVQSHQRSLNEMGGSGGTGGGDNQLARWFSPELLARASAGKLPSVHVPNALSLEDLERHHHSPAPPVRN